MDDPLSYASAFSPFLITGLDPVWPIVLYFSGILALLLCSGMISGSEVAFFALSAKDIDGISQDHLKKKVQQLLEHPKRLLATILIANNAVNLTIVILSGFITSYFFSGTDIAFYMVFIVQVILVTFLILLFGEVVPKIYATKYPALFIRLMTRPLAILNILLRWLSEPLILSTNFMDRRLKKKSSQSLSADELSAVIDMTRDDTITDEEKKIWKGIVEFGTIEVKETMTPRTDVVAVDLEMHFPELLALLIDSGYSRMPVYVGSLDKVEGILYIKDLLPYLDRKEFEWQNLVRPAYFVPENKKIDDLLKEFQAQKIHMAIVVDEYGGSAGIITLEDVIEEIVGEINDEFDDEQIVYSKLDDFNYVFEGKTPLINLCRVLNIGYETIEPYVGDAESLAGLVLQLIGKLPEKNQVIVCNDLSFTIESVDKRRIKRVKVTKMKEEQESRAKNEKGGNLHVIVLLVVLLTGLASCREPEVFNPKPRGFFHVTIPEASYQVYQSECPFTFEYPKDAEIKPYEGPQQQECWLNIFYPAYNATIHMSYTRLHNDLGKYLDDAYKMAYNHAVKSEGIKQKLVINETSHVYGNIYDLEGDPATTYQFYVTDSTNHFFRGSVYFNFHPNYDSLKPVVARLKSDVDHLVETFQWK